jgi:hypothetical protein
MRGERSSRERPCADRERAERGERQQRHATEPAHQYVSPSRALTRALHQARDVGPVHIQAAQSINHFFEVYEALEPGKEVETATWVNQAAAYSEIEACRERARTTGDQGG